jgi:hypothetical protein
MSLLWTILGRIAPALETKVSAATLGALIGAALSWALDTYVFTSGVPGVAEQLVEWIAPILGAIVFGWLAPHTPRPPELVPMDRPKVETTPPPP